MDKKGANVLLKKVPLFSRLSEKALASIVKVAIEKEFKSGTQIVSEGDTGTGFYLIISGSTEVSRSGAKIAKLRAGEFFGEMALLDGAPRSADVTALEDTKCLVLTLWVLKGIIAANPNVALGMLEELARRLREAEQTRS
jgi:CRP-like cAMP-binding protein